MKKTILAVAMLVAMGGAFATPNDTATSCPGNSCHNTNTSNNTNKSTNVNVNVNSNRATAVNNVRNSNRQEQNQAQKQRQSQSATSSSDNANNASQTTSFNAPRNAASSANAAGLAASNGTCMGSVSGAAQGLTVGVSIGKTYIDEACNRRYNAQMLQALGQEDAALILMCQDDAVREAVNYAGGNCPDRNTTMQTRISEGYSDSFRDSIGLNPLK